MLIGLNKFSSQVRFVADDGVNDIKLDILELEFGRSEVFAIFLNNSFELLLHFWVG